MDDASLDEFLTDSGEESDGSDKYTDSDGTAAEDSADTPADDEDTTVTPEPEVEPATATSRWDPEGVACENCGTAVERRWRDDGWVCRECKEW